MGGDARYRCAGCRLDVLEHREIFVLDDNVWHALAGTDANKFLCLACVETRLGRQLRPSDFPNWPVNRYGMFGKGHSDRLRERMGLAA